MIILMRVISMLISIMISLYAYSAVRSVSRSGLVFLLLAALYTILYSLLKLEDYALLVGTVLLLVILATVMYFTRHIGSETQNNFEATPADEVKLSKTGIIAELNEQEEGR